MRRHLLLKNRKLLAGPYLFWSVSFIIIPLLMIFYYGLTDKEGTFTWSNIAMMASPENLKALGLALLLSLVSTLICLVLAYPLAMILSEKNMNQTSLIVLIFILPMWMNFLLRTMAWQLILSNNGVLNTLLGFLHLPKVHIIYTFQAVLIGMVYDFLPFMILPIYNSLSSIGDDVVEAGKDLGASYFTILRKIIFPLSLPGVISGITMVFVPSMTSFVISNILGGSNTLLIGNIIEQEFTYNFNWNLGSGLSFVLLVFTLISMGLMSVFDKSEGGTNIW